MGINCFEKVREMNFIGFPNLELLNMNKENFRIWTRYDNDVWDCGVEGGICRIQLCPKLKTIVMGSKVLFNYRSLEIEHLPNLEVIQMGHYCLPLAHQLVLRGTCDE